MRIAFVTTSYPAHPGDPAGHFVAAEAEALARRGHAVTVFALGPDNQNEGGNPSVSRIGVGDLAARHGALPRLAERPWLWARVPRFALRVRRQLSASGPYDRIVSHWLLPSAWPIAVGLGGAHEVVAHGSDIALLERLPSYLGRRILRALVRSKARIRAVSQDLQSRLLAIEPTLEPQIRVEASPIAITHVPRRAVARRSLRIGEGRPLLLVVGRLLPQKRVSWALEIACAVSGAQVVVVGDGPEGAALRRRFPRVRFVGHVPRNVALTWIAAADVLISASRDEGAPTAIREARQLGVPVVAASAGDLLTWSASDPGLFVSEQLKPATISAALAAAQPRH